MDWFLYDRDLRHERVNENSSQGIMKSIIYVRLIDDTRLK